MTSNAIRHIVRHMTSPKIRHVMRPTGNQDEMFQMRFMMRDMWSGIW
jgi:hypothetical protein